MKRSLLLVAVIGAGLLSFCTAPPPAAIPDMADLAFVPLRPPVLGLAIQHEAGAGLYRLVRVADESGGAAEVLTEGDLKACETALAATLEERFGHGRPNVKLATLGGLQLWADRMWLGGWRIQEHVYTGHFRLLSPRSLRHAWGSWEECRVALEQVRVEGLIAQPRPRLVVLLHGLGRGTSPWSKMEEALDAAGWDVARITYPSTRRSLAEHAAQLADILDRAEGAEEVHFVTHSLGGLVVRALLARGGDPWRERIRVGRLVMLAPPSQGSAIADSMKDFLPFEWLAGPVGKELALRDQQLFPTPPCEFAIIAGGKGDGKGWNPLLEGDDDGVVTVEETRLDGAKDFLVVERLHTWLMRAPEVIAAVESFLETGQFSPDRGEE
ncbi:MAG: alpha/beta fold hydrolase [Planctomycetes bacterium]|nr:alpha/beta fold hydrolase [Planctomycetota bacterium]